MSDTLEIRRGGKLFKLFWDSDTRTYKEEEVTSSAISRLWDPCRIEEGVTLRDIFLLINAELEIFNTLFTNWCKEIVEEGLMAPVPIPSDEPEEKKMEFLELQWGFECSRFNNEAWEMSGMSHPSFHGIGVQLSRDVEGPEGFKKGDRISWSLTFRKANELAPYPIKLKSELSISAFEYQDEPVAIPNKHSTKYPAAEFTLGNILYGIIWELSFFGSPKERDNKGAEIHRNWEDVKSGRAKLVPFKKILLKGDT